MTIRHATLADIPALVQGGRRMHALTRFRRFDYDEARVAAAFADVITHGQHKYLFLVAEDSAMQVVGALIGVLEQHLFSPQLTASIMHFDVLPEARMGGHAVRLLRAFEAWARNRQVLEITFGINSGEDLERLARFAERVGYMKIGMVFVKAER